MLAHTKLISVQPDDFRDSDMLLQRAGSFSWPFSTLHTIQVYIPLTHEKKPAAKEERHEKHAGKYHHNKQHSPMEHKTADDDTPTRRQFF